MSEIKKRVPQCNFKIDLKSYKSQMSNPDKKDLTYMLRFHNNLK
jgi:hypothetical protein